MSPEEPRGGFLPTAGRNVQTGDSRAVTLSPLETLAQIENNFGLVNRWERKLIVVTSILLAE